MALFRRKPLHERLAEEGGLVAPEEPGPAPGREPPAPDPTVLDEHFFGERSIPFWERLSGEVASPRPRRWDAVVTAEADIDGDEVAFVALPDGSLLVEEQVGDKALDPLARAVEERIQPPFRARGVRQRGRVWGVSATRIRVEQFRAEGDGIELAVTDTEETLVVDGERTLGSVSALERIGEAEGSSYVVRASRLDGDLWEVQSHPL